MRIILLLSFLIPLTSWSTSLVLLTDQTPPKKAEEVQKVLKTLYPFNQFDLGLKIVTIEKDRLKCAETPGIPRLVQCNNAEIAKVKAANKVDMILTISALTIYGGSGGSFPVMTAGSPAGVGVHELLHHLGFTDEYTYSAYEAAYYKYICNSGLKSPNVTCIKDISAPITSNTDALNLYKDKIPWGELFTEETMITHDNESELGSGEIAGCEEFNFSDTPKDVEVGLYRGSICDNANPPIPVWYPGPKQTIMYSIACGLSGYYEQVISKILTSNGTRALVRN